MPESPIEAEFVGDGRQALVTGLVALFDRVQAEKRPVWVSLEAPTGWGKTRIAREFYGELARTRQSEPAYWPAAIVDGVTPLSERRKSVNPRDFHHVPASLPNYLWWGVACSVRNGTPSEALLQDICVLRKHIDHLENAWWYRAGFVEKYATPAFYELREKVLEEGKSAAVDFAMTQLGDLVGATIPGFSAMAWLLKKGIAHGKAAVGRTRTLAGSEEIVYHADEVDEVEAFLLKIAPLVPPVLFIEDVHDADDLLVELVERLIRRDEPVMILTTGWTGYIDENPGVAQAMRVAGDRIIRIDEETNDLPVPFPPGASLHALDTNDLAAILRSYHEEVSTETRRALLTKFRNPYALELALDEYGEAETDVLSIDVDVIEKLSGDVNDMYRVAWDRLDKAGRERLTLATLGIPAVISGDSDDSRVWDHALLLKAVALLAENDRALLAERSVDRAWVRIIDDPLRQFHEPAQMNIAAGRFVKVEQRVREALIHEATRLVNAEDVPADRVAHASRLLLAFDDGLDDDALVQASSALIGVLQDLPREVESIVRVGERAYPKLNLRLQRDRDLLWSLATAQREVGRPRRAIDLLRELLHVELEHPDVSPADIAGTRHALARALSSAGQPLTAVKELEALLGQQREAEMPDVESIMGTETELAVALAEADRPKEAIRLNEALLEAQLNVLGESSDVALTRLRLGRALTDAGRADEALALLRIAVSDLSSTKGADHPWTFTARASLASTTERVRGPVEALALYESLLADEQRALSPDSIEALTARENIARVTDSAGRSIEAIELFTRLIADEERILAPDHPNLIRTRANLGAALMGAGRPAEAEQVFRGILASLPEGYEQESAGFLSVRSSLAWALSKGGKHDEALQIYSAVLDARIERLSAAHPDVDRTREDVAHELIAIGEIERAERQLDSLIVSVAERTAPCSPEVLRASRVFCHALNGQGAYAVAERRLRALLAEQTTVDPRDELEEAKTRRLLAVSLTGAGKHSESRGLLRDDVKVRRERLSDVHPETVSAHVGLSAVEGPS